MSLAPDPLLSVIGNAARFAHFELGKGALERHTGSRYDFSEAALRSLPREHWSALVTRLPPPYNEMTQVVLCPIGPGSVLGERVAEKMNVPFVLAYGRDQNCELIYEEQAGTRLNGKVCLLVDVCGETMATLAGLSATAKLHGANVCAALVLMVLQRIIDGRRIPTLPLDFPVVSYAIRNGELWTSSQCPSCRQRQLLRGGRDDDVLAVRSRTGPAATSNGDD